MANGEMTVYTPPEWVQIKTCAVDFDSRALAAPVHLVQYDRTMPVLEVELYRKGEPYAVPAGADINIRMDKKEGHHVYSPALGLSDDRTKAYIAVTPQMTTTAGTLYPIIEVMANGGVASTSPLRLQFDPNPVPEDAITSSDEYKTLEQIVADVNNAAASAQNSAAAAKNSETEAAKSAADAREIKDSMPADYTAMSGDVGTLKNQMQRAYPDDSTIGENPWSSKHIIDMLCPEIKESGNPVLCYPVAGYPLGVKASWEPVREGSGTPYPAGGGKNQLNPAEYEAATKTINGITFTRLNTGEVVVSGTATGTAIYVLIKSFSYPIALSTDRNWSIVGENVISAQGLVSGVTVIRPSDNTSLYIRVESGATVKTTVQPQIEKGNTPTAWEPYENIRPIKGRDSVRVERCGENLIKYPKVRKTYGIELSVYDNKLTVKGTCSFPVSIESDNIYLPDDTYTLSSDVLIPKNAYISAYTDIEKLLLNFNTRKVTGRVSGNTHMLIYLDPGTYNFTVQVSLVLGTTAPTTYTPYIGQTNTLTLPETVYGGEVDAVTGTTKSLYVFKAFDGTEDLIERAQGQYAFYLPETSDNGICSHFKSLSSDDLHNGVKGTYLRYTIAAIFNTNFASVDEFKSYLRSQAEAGTPVQICYTRVPGAANKIITATGAQPLPALKGTNTVLTDADSATVTGRADPIKRIEDLEAAVASIN